MAGVSVARALVVLSVLLASAATPVVASTVVTDTAVDDAASGDVVSGDVVPGDGASGGSDVASDIDAASDGDVHLTVTLALSPERPGSIDVTLRYAVPDRVVDLSTTLPDGATVTATRRFRRESAHVYEWTGGRDPSLTYRLPVNRTGSQTGPEGGEGRYLTTDAGPWAIVTRPSLSTSLRYSGAEPTVERDVRVAGDGVVGSALVYLGPHETTRRTVDGQEFVLVVPDAVESMGTSRERVFEVLAGASALPLGDRDDTVVAVVAPDTGSWAVRGLQVGESDFYVVADADVDGPNDVWSHEYVHTRQDFETTDGTRWLLEGTATYYAALLALEDGRLRYERFEAWLAVGRESPQAESVLADPSTWANDAEYRKGALVAGVLDRRLRAEGSSLAAVLRRANARDDPLTTDAFVALVRRAGGDEVASDARRYTTTGDVPPTWTQREHEAAFGDLPANLRYGLAGVDATGTLRITGPYRSATDVGDRVTLVAGERLAVNATVTNVGGSSGSYERPVTLDGAVLTTTSGTLGPDETAEVRVDRRFTDPGNYTLAYGVTTLTVVVRPPASLTVRGVEAPDEAVVGGTVPLRVTLGNDADRPGRQTLTVVRDGTPVAQRDVTLPAGATETVTVPVEVDTAGTTRIGLADGTSVSVTVQAEETTEGGAQTTDGERATTRAGSVDAGGEAETTEAETPGFGVVTAVVALVLSLLLVRRSGGSR